jgi:3-oxoadipate enol-lactonase
MAIRIAKSGAGDPGLMFLHYWGGSSRNWRDVTDRLIA